jgi:TonB family protein
MQGGVMRGILVAGWSLMLALNQAVQPPRQPRQPALPTAQRVTVHDGDLIVADNAARVRVVRRADANVRAIYNNADRWLVLLLDTAGPDGRPPDGGVDVSYTFNDVSGDWPLGDRWEGSVVVEEYYTLGETVGMNGQGAGLVTPSGLIQLLSRTASDGFRDQAAASTLTYTGFGRGGGGNQPFAAVEAQQIASASRSARNRAPLAGGFSTSVGMTIESAGGGVSTAAPAVSPPPEAPVRVGGNIRTPRKIADAAPVMPPGAAQANIRGVVILEIVVGADGAVRDARILRSIPPLDQAALDAVRQWRYEPTLLNGTAVPVIMTVTVNFL